jgi:hypothetical protein
MGGILKEKRDRRRFMRRVYLLAQQAEIQTKKHKAEEMQEVAVQENFRRDGCSLSFFFWKNWWAKTKEMQRKIQFESWAKTEQIRKKIVWGGLHPRVQHGPSPVRREERTCRLVRCHSPPVVRSDGARRARR